MMKQGIILIYTAWGVLINTQGLVTVLEAGIIESVALDALEGEEEIFYCDYTHKELGHPFLLAL